MSVGAIGKSLHKGFVPTTHEEMAEHGPEYGQALSYYGRVLRDVRRAAANPSALRATVWSYGVIRPPLMEYIEAQSTKLPQAMWCCRGGPRNYLVVENMPGSFDDFADARRWWEVTQHAVTHTSNIVFRITHKGLAPMSAADTKGMKVAMKEADYGRMATDADSAGNIHPKSQHYTDSLERWWLVFRPLWETAEAEKDQDMVKYLQGAQLRVQYLNLYASIMAPLGYDYQSIVAMTPIYREIMRLSDEILARQRERYAPDMQGGIFSMDAAVTFPLFQTSMRCRDAGLREDAIRLLQENPRRDGMWDSRVFEALMVQNRVLETENAKEGTIDEQWSRLQMRRAHLDEEGTLKNIALFKDVAAGNWRPEQESVGRFLYD
ncbi:hypothetical protein ACHAQH_006220 [Verticillium albo-atrum]